MWINKLYSNKKISNKYLLTLLVFIIPIVIIFSPYLITHGKELINYKWTTIFSLFFAFIWSYIGPLLINNYTIFFKNTAKKIQDMSTNFNDITVDNDINISISTYNNEVKKYKKIQPIIFIIWASIISFIMLINNYAFTHYYINGIFDIYFWLLLTYVIFIAYLQSIGFTWLYLSLNYLVSIIKHEKTISDILESDFEKGIHILGSIIIRTAICFFSGILYFPILIDFSYNIDKKLVVYVYLLIILYLLAIIIYIFVSAFYISSYAGKYKNTILDEFKSEYTKLFKESINNNEDDSIEEKILQELKINNYINHINQIEKINIWPISSSKLFFAIFSVVFPILFFISDFYELLQNFGIHL